MHEAEGMQETAEANYRELTDAVANGELILGSPVSVKVWMRWNIPAEIVPHGELLARRYTAAAAHQQQHGYWPQQHQHCCTAASLPPPHSSSCHHYEFLVREARFSALQLPHSLTGPERICRPSLNCL